MARRGNSGGSNIVELLGLLVAAISLLVTLSDKWQANDSGGQPPTEQHEHRQAPQTDQPDFQERRGLPQQERPRSFKRQDRLMPSKSEDRLPHE
jgi:hypothetical protein